MNPVLFLFGLVIAAAAAAFVASLAYAGLYYAFDNSTWMFQALQDDMLASYRAARLSAAKRRTTGEALGTIMATIISHHMTQMTIA